MLPLSAWWWAQWGLRGRVADGAASCSALDAHERITVALFMADTLERQVHKLEREVAVMQPNGGCKSAALGTIAIVSLANPSNDRKPHDLRGTSRLATLPDGRLIQPP